MKTDPNKIQDTQFLFTVACFIQASSLLTSFMVTINTNESWLIVVLAFVSCLPLIWLYRTMMVSWPGKNLVQLLEAAYGKAAGKILGLLYAWFFITINALSLLDLGNFVKLTVMVDTPYIVLVVICALVSAWAVRGGLGVVTRYGMMFSLGSLLVLLVSFLLLLNQLNWRNLLPVFNQPLKNYIQGTHMVSTMPIGELVSFLMITPSLALSGRNISRYLFIGYAMGALTFLVVLVRDVGVLGNTMQMFTLPSLVVLRLVTVGEALSRIEVLFALVLVILLFAKIVFQHYVSVATVAQVFGTKDHKHLAFSMGALLVFYGMTLYPNSVIHLLSAQETIPFIWAVFQLVIPIVTFITLKLRGLPVKKEA